MDSATSATSATTPDPDERARALAAVSLEQGDPTGWFERLYAEASEGSAVVPWDVGHPQAVLVDWARERRGEGRSALVVGCGLGRDAEFFSGLGYTTTAFDISESAVRTTRARFPDSRVEYVIADLFDVPAAWRRGFDLVVESLTVQSMPRSVRERATAAVAELVAPGGTLVVSAACRPDGAADDADDADDAEAGPPWPLTEKEIAAFATGGLTTVSIERKPPAGPGGFDRWIAEFRR
ncbi:class I SAM-dependent methyltransferase [Labedaea rhizosphaerae]|uniref:Methyltransferase family protein n=1 Tax=Labedaea rhizosphaerae TaxID=598644 RepID=A0A4R6SDY6_LABRH|nr:class I SAM-dependent methyltransferase [Labedaea rhizosphaerae]TDP97907.1 methyltransferase family protein [Labedaea rhizosphaerae]